MSEKTENSSSNNRWWESYLVRYFLGFIVGAICVGTIVRFADVVPGSLSLMQSAGQAVENESKYGITAIIIGISLLGLAYCYIASTPITVLHAGRYSKGPVNRLSRFFWFSWILVLGVLMIRPQAATFRFEHEKIIYLLIFFISISLITWWAIKRFSGLESKASDSESETLNNASNRTDATKTANNTETTYQRADYWLLLGFFFAIWSFSQSVPLSLGVQPQISDVRLLAIGTPVIWIGIAQYFVLFRILSTSNENYRFYKNLFAARQQTGAKDVRDTYSHLREHSNAIFIVAVEISMLALILGGIKIGRMANIVQSSPLDEATFWLSALGIWIVPTIFMWSRANAMERHFADNPANFITKEDFGTGGQSHNSDT